MTSKLLSKVLYYTNLDYCNYLNNANVKQRPKERRVNKTLRLPSCRKVGGERDRDLLWCPPAGLWARRRGAGSGATDTHSRHNTTREMK